MVVALAGDPRDFRRAADGTVDVLHDFGASARDVPSRARPRAAGVRYFFREQAFILATATVLTNLRRALDVRFSGELAVGAPLTRYLALEVSYAILHDNVPDDGADADGRVDRFLTASVQVRFEAC
jgi:hypothetical protein